MNGQFSKTRRTWDGSYPSRRKHRIHEKLAIGRQPSETERQIVEMQDQMAKLRDQVADLQVQLMDLQSSVPEGAEQKIERPAGRSRQAG